MNNTKLSTFMTKILRHEPHKFGVSVDEYGYCDIEQLLVSIRKQPNWKTISIEDIVEIDKNNSKPRFKTKGDLIRARYGHSFPVKLEQDSERELPPYLFHGTHELALIGIMSNKEGIKPMGRESVHLSETRFFSDLAAKRRKNPKMVKVHTTKASQMGVEFVYVGNEVWLSTAIPFECVEEVPF